MNRMIKIMIIGIIILMIAIFSLNIYVVNSTKNEIVKEENVSNIEGVDCILILGAGIWGDKPSPMLEDRLKEGIVLYKQGTTKKIIMSGDHSREDYDEVKIMKEYAESEGVPSEDIFMDHAGFSSYDSVYRAKEIFGVQKMIIVTQKYHLYRSLYIAKKLGIEAYGIESNLRTYPGQVFREIREILARDKDYFKCIMKPEASIMGEKISLDGSGDITND
ncbi:MAG: SanA protein [Clostridiales bacterium]|nr:SanA protein [Clostridiales bacterium]